jgi:hypothetical protein
MRSASRRLFALLPALLLGAGACDGALPTDGADDVAIARFALTSVPSGLHCVRFTVDSGTTTSQQKFSLTGGSTAEITVGGLPPGPCKVVAEAFTQTCSSVNAGTAATWVSAPAMASLAPGEVSTVVITLKPDARLTGSLDFVSLTVAPTTLNTGSVVVGGSAIQALSVKNVGTATTGTLSAAIAGTTEFTIAGTTCATLAADATCSYQIRFQPTSPGSKTAILTITGAPGGSVGATLVGVGLAPALLVLGPSFMDFGNIGLGGSAIRTFTVANNGGSPSGVVSFAMSGPDPADFQVLSTTCGVVPAGASCGVTVRFQPVVVTIGTWNATLTATGAPGGSSSAMLTGRVGLF